ncbi:coiled-coil domain-containing protein 81-like [Phalacrocorax aristotelis]|uniref:coiled-coil domain-containing protein 81-like n=1 Tax=Phalacrocorax aristotelis TaxID=126867 RepID=UPI003F4B2EE5
MLGEDKVLPVERPVFRPCRFLKKFYKLRCAKTKIPDETLSVPLDFEQIAADIHFRREIVEQCIHETLLFFAGALRDNKEVEFCFKSIGIVAVRRKAVGMTFFDDCLLELDATGNMLAALLEDSKMRGIVAFPGKNRFYAAQPRRGHHAAKVSGMASAAPGRSREQLLVSVLDPVFLACRRVSLARQLAKAGEQAKAAKADQAR